MRRIALDSATVEILSAHRDRGGSNYYRVDMVCGTL
jgi:hypothetical protein